MKNSLALEVTLDDMTFAIFNYVISDSIKFFDIFLFNCLILFVLISLLISLLILPVIFILVSKKTFGTKRYFNYFQYLNI